MKESENTLSNYQHNPDKRGQENSAVCLKDITVYLMGAQGTFLDTLALIGKGKGVEHLVYDSFSHKHVLKPVRTRSDNEKYSAVFTGSGLCVMAVFGLHDGLIEHIGRHLTIKVKAMRIWFNKEGFGGAGGFYRELYGAHAVLEVSDPITETSVFIDPTYGQVSSLWKGKFLIFQPEEIGDFYQTGVEELPEGNYSCPDKQPLAQADLLNITDERDEQLKYLEGLMGITRTEYSQLVGSISGRKL